jgi:glycosyltransferase involved in cell wall biosynthesis
VRVLQVMAGAGHGGAEAFFCRLVPALGRAGVEQRAVIRANPERAATLSAAGIETVQMAFGGLLDVRTRLRLKREIGRFHPAIVMSWMNRATMSCPRGRFIHIGRLGGYYDLKYYRRCDHLIANTRDIVRYLVAGGIHADRVHYVPNFVTEVPAEAAPRHAFATPDDAPLVLAMGRLHPNKAFDVLLDALAEVPEAILWLAGEGPERPRLEQQARELGLWSRVRFLGWRDDVNALLRAADVFVCPSRHEPLGNVVLEAWAQAVPVVAAASQGPGSLIRHRHNGLLVARDDPRALAQAIREVLSVSDFAAALGGRGRAAYDAEFTEAKVVGQFIDLFERVGGRA